MNMLSVKDPRLDKPVGGISYAYAQGMVGPERACTKLLQWPGEGTLMAAEIMLEQAYLCQDHLMLDKSEELYLKTCDGTRRTKSSLINSVSAKALAQQARMGVHHKLIDGELPDIEQARRVYLSDLTIGRLLKESKDRFDEEEGSNIVGFLGELSVTGLLERVSLELGPSSWYPMFSLFSEGHKNVKGSSVIQGWDVSVLTSLEQNRNPQLTYAVEVKSNVNQIGSAKLAEGITLVAIRPCLEVSKNEGFIPQKILTGCMIECQKDCERVTSELDQRTDQLLDIMG